jgi:hypothetical protein
MEQVFIPILLGVTSVGAYLLGARGLKLPGRGIRRAINKMLECLGMTLVFLGVNITVGVIVILAARAMTGGFVSLYLAADGTLLPLSLIQGLTFQWWRDLSIPRPPRSSRQ